MAGETPSDGGAELVAALEDSDPSVRKAAAFAMSSCLTEENQPALIRAAGDADGMVRAAAVATLGMYKDEQAARKLGEALAGDANEAVQKYAASGLGVNPTPHAVVALLQNAEGHRSMTVRRLAMKHLVRKVGLRTWRELDPTSRDWAGLVESIKAQKRIQDAYAACGVALQRRPQDTTSDSPEHDAAERQTPRGAGD
jgi:hypothetical protein